MSKTGWLDSHDIHFYREIACCFGGHLGLFITTYPHIRAWITYYNERGYIAEDRVFTQTFANGEYDAAKQALEQAADRWLNKKAR